MAISKQFNRATNELARELRETLQKSIYDVFGMLTITTRPRQR